MTDIMIYPNCSETVYCLDVDLKRLNQKEIDAIFELLADEYDCQLCNRRETLWLDDIHEDDFLDAIFFLPFKNKLDWEGSYEQR